MNIFSRFIQKLTLVQITQTSDKVKCGNVEMTQLRRKGNSEATGIPGCPLPIHSLPLLEIHTKQSNPTHQTVQKHLQNSFEPVNRECLSLTVSDGYMCVASNLIAVRISSNEENLIYPFVLDGDAIDFPIVLSHTHKSVLSEEHEARSNLS